MRYLFLLSTILFLHTASYSQLLKKLKESNPVASLVEGKKPITTNFKDVKLDGKLEPSFGENEKYKPLHSMPKDEEGSYLLEPGFYQVTNLSYCLKAGTNGPAKGDAYGLAFLEGKMEDIVEVILVKSQEMWRGGNKDTSKTVAATLASGVTRVSQKDVQLLLWAIIAKAHFEDMAGRTKAVALALLTPEQLLKLNGGAVKSAVNFASEKGFFEKPQWLQKMEQAEQNMRSLYSKGDATYEDFERLAVLAGAANEPNPVEAGTWFKHKEGYYVRYEPQGYSRTTIKVYVPEGKKVKFMATTSVATPSDSRQRLAQTDMAVEEYEKSFLGKLK
jgi:hypothetical protein